MLTAVSSSCTKAVVWYTRFLLLTTSPFSTISSSTATIYSFVTLTCSLASSMKFFRRSEPWRANLVALFESSRPIGLLSFLYNPKDWYAITARSAVYGIRRFATVWHHVTACIYLRIDYTHHFVMIPCRRQAADYIHGFAVIFYLFHLAPNTARQQGRCFRKKTRVETSQTAKHSRIVRVQQLHPRHPAHSPMLRIFPSSSPEGKIRQVPV